MLSRPIWQESGQQTDSGALLPSKQTVQHPCSVFLRLIGLSDEVFVLCFSHWELLNVLLDELKESWLEDPF